MRGLTVRVIKLAVLTIFNKSKKLNNLEQIQSTLKKTGKMFHRRKLISTTYRC